MTIAGVETSRRKRYWLRVFVSGLIVWLACIATLAVTHVNTLIPSVIFVGSFLIPVTFTVWVIEREQFTGADPQGNPTALRVTIIVAAFGFAGLMGVVISALLETFILNVLPGTFWYLGVAIIEETVKIAMVWLLARNLAYYTMRDGMVLGACVGFGFAAFESAGYAFNALIQSNDQDLVPVVETLVVRGFLTPVGHGLWTALLAGALFAAAAKTGKLHLTWSVVGWWFVVVALHWMWDASNGLAAILALKSTGAQPTLEVFDTGKIPDPTPAQVHLLAIYQWVFLSVCAVIGIFLANRMWVKGRAVVPGYPYGPPELDDEPTSPAPS